MRLNYLKNPSVKTATFKADKLGVLTEFCHNACIDDVITSARTFKLILSNVKVHLKKFYTLGERIFAFGADGVLYEYKNGGIIALTGKLTTEPMLCEVLHGGLPSVFALCKDCAFIIGQTSINPCDITYGDAIEAFDGRIFVALNDKLYCTKEFDFENNNFNYSIGGIITFGIDGGNIVDLTAVSDYLLIVCKNAVYKLTTNSELGYNLEKLSVPKLNVYKNSVKNFGDEVLFLSDDEIYSYNNGSVKKIESKLCALGVSVCGDAKRMKRTYYFPIRREGTEEGYLFYIDREKNREGIISMQNLYVGDGGFLESNFCIYSLSDDGDVALADFNWESKELTFDNPYKKSIIEISIFTSEQATMKVFGDFGEKKFRLKEGLNVKRTNLFSDSIKIQVNSSSKTFALKDLQIKYRKIGE